MTRFSIVAAVALVVLSLTVRADWYALNEPETASAKIENGGLVTRRDVRPVELRVVSIALRHHRGNLGKHVLELTVEPPPLRSATYILVVGDTLIDDIKATGQGLTIGFDSISLARTCLKHLREVNQLDAEHSRDETFKRPENSDVRHSTLSNLVRQTEILFWGDQSTLMRFSARVRELAQGADSIFADDLNKDLGYLAEETSEIKALSVRLLPLFTPPPRPRQATVRIIRDSLELLEHVHRIHARSGIVTAKLGTYFKTRNAEKPFEQLRFDISLLRDAALSYHMGVSSFIREEL